MRWQIALISAACAAWLTGCSGEPTPSACQNVTCSGHGTCSEVDGAASCQCDSGYTADGTSCVAPASDPCSPNPCQAAYRSVCQAVGSTAICQCDQGYRDSGNGGCALADPCNPNPCTGTHQTVCTVSGTAAVCSCDHGYVPDGNGGCQLEPPPDCTAKHTAGDSHEPDECAALAKATTMPAVDAHTIEPAGDVDWISFTVTTTRIYSATATSTSWTPVIFLYAENGIDVLAQATPSSGKTAAVKKRLVPGKYLLKVRAANASDVGPYSLALADEGPDNDGDTFAESTVVTPGTPKSAAIDYPGDVDFFEFTAIPGHIYQMKVTAGSSVDFAYYADPTATESASSYGTSVTFTRKLFAAGPWYLRVRSTLGGTTSYQLSVTDLGLDDFGDTAAQAGTVAVGTTNGKFEWEGDDDFLQFASLPNHVYKIGVSAGVSSSVVLFLDGATTSSAQDYGTAVTFTRKLTTAGPQIIELHPGTWGTLGSYAVSITDLGLDDFGDTQATAGAIGTGTTAAKFDFQGDWDWFKFDSIPGHIYRVAYAGSFSAYLTLQLDGDTSFNVQDWGTAVTFTRKALTAGPQYVLARAYDSTLVGAYTVTVTDLGVDDFGDTQATAGAIGTGTTNAKFDFEGDWDWFKFDSVPGHIYQVKYAGPMAAYLTLFLDGNTSFNVQDWGTAVTFTRKAATAGPQYLLARAYSSTSLGGYTVTVTDLGVDDFGDTQATAGAIGLGTTNARFDFEGDWDFFKFDSIPGHIYQVKYSGVASAYLTLLLDGNTTFNVQDWGTAVTFTRKAATAGPQYALARAYSTTSLGSYTVTVTDLGVDDFGDTQATAGAIGLGTTNARFDFEGDWDWFKFDSIANHIYQVKYAGPMAGYLTLLLDGNTSFNVQDWGTAVSFTRLATTSGPQYALARAYDSTRLGAYSVTVTDLGQDDFGNSAATASALTVGAAATAGSIQYFGDEDWFSFATNGQLAYQVTATGMSTTIEIRSNTGVIASLSGPGNKAFSVPAAGTYFVRVLPSSSGAMGNYTIAVAP